MPEGVVARSRDAFRPTAAPRSKGNSRSRQVRILAPSPALGGVVVDPFRVPVADATSMVVLLLLPAERPLAGRRGQPNNSHMTTTFITGANKGLGRETARRLVELGHTVLIGARNPDQGAQVAAALGARFVRIDVTDDGSVAAAAADVAEHEGSIDVLSTTPGLPGRPAIPPP